MSKQIPVVSIVGRRNVGKSTLFNAVIKEKKAIVDEYAGLTRDVLSYNMSYEGKNFILSDTPGLDLPGNEELSLAILEKAERQLVNSSVIIFLMEYPGPGSYDWKLAERLRRLSVPAIIAVNKMDNNERMENVSNFYEMGFNDIIPVSALNRKNINMLMNRLSEILPHSGGEIKEPDITIAIAGRPNSGKSTLLNALMGFERAVVSDIPGTTRDSVDDFFAYHGKLVRIVDTAGIRRKSKSADGIEFFSFKRALDSIHRCDIVIHLIDALVGISETDKKISDAVVKEGKPMIIAVNKWDAIEEKDHKTFEEFKDKTIFKFYKAYDFPIISISAKNKVRIDKIVQKAVELKEKSSQRIDTPKLNKLLERLQKSGALPQTGGRIRVYYAAQINTVPPQFKFFVNNASLFRKDIIRYFEKELQKEFNLKGIPVIIHLEGKKPRN
ncbi:MAG: ribosome biogenesis GTPase Der [Spirochaetia bacterium]|jgi:GTP-binding protein|nr:ribosome biogenesis GTPase Der [Spirochaetia bacterium]